MAENPAVAQSAVAQTALGPMVIAAIEQLWPAGQRLIDDPLAGPILPRSMRWTVGACRWRPLRQAMIRAAERRGRGIWTSILCRKRYADDQVEAAIRAGITQLVVLGAGLDTRAARLAVPAGMTSYEVDMPGNSELKRRRLAALLGRVPDALRLVPIDFESDDLFAALAGQGFDPAVPTMFVWEAVTQYLTEEGVRRTLGSLSAAASGSRLIFTYIRRDFLDGAAIDGSEAMYRQFVQRQPIWRFGLDRDGVGQLLEPYGWRLSEQVDEHAYTDRYLRPAGRSGPVSDVELFVTAERP